MFYGWIVVAAAFAITLLGFGCAYTFSTFVESFQREYQASRGSVSLVFSLAGFLYFSFGAVSGPLADRYGARRLALLGMVLLGAGLALASIARTLTEVYLAYGLGVGFGVGCSYVPAIAAVQRWFVKRRGTASGLAVSGIGVGTLIMPPIASQLISAIGWRNSYLVLGIAAAVLGVAASVFLESDPRDRGLGPDGGPPIAHTGSRVRPGPTLRTVIVSRRFILLYLAGLGCSLALFVPFVHLVPYAEDHGIPKSSATLLLSAIGVGSTAGRFFLGGVADRLGRHRALLIMFVGIGGSLAIWLFAAELWSLAAFALVFGVFYGGYVAIIPALMTDYFDGPQLTTIMGTMTSCVGVGTLIGPAAAGFAYDLSHSYTVPILASIAATIIATGFLVAVGRVAAAESPAPATAVRSRPDRPRR